MQLYLVRHGQSRGNVVTYDLPDGDLTPLGLRQAEETAARLEREGIELIISSPLRRAMQTADALRRRIGVPHEVWRDLSEYREQEPARFLGRKAVAELFPLALCDEQIPDDGYELGLENRELGHGRAVRLVERIRSRFAETPMRVAIFAHGTLNSFLIMALAGRPVGPGCWFDQNNCCINRVVVEPQRVRFLGINDVSHITEVS